MIDPQGYPQPVNVLTVYHVHISTKDLSPELQELIISRMINIGREEDIVLERIIEENYKGEMVPGKLTIKKEREANEGTNSFLNYDFSRHTNKLHS